MKMRGVCGMAVRAIAISGIAAATMFVARSFARRKMRYREIPVE